MRLVCPWLCEFVRVPGDPDSIAREISLRGFEVAGVEPGRLPVIDFEITANRPDCLSHLGLAREASAIWGLPLQMPDMAALPSSGVSDPAPAVGVTIEAPDLCPRYCAQVFEVRVGESPPWLTDRLEAAGVRAINNIVDVTNYVMLELGQPMHAFDLERIGGRRLVIRRAAPGERLRTLDGVDRSLDPDMLLIADVERALAIGGVMGGHDSEIGPTTTRIALESAYFQPASIRRTSRRLGLKTEAASRFERGGDVNAPPAGIARAAALFEKIGAGHPLGALIDQYPSPKRPLQLRLRSSRIARLLGQAVPAEDVPRLLEPLGFVVARADAEPETAWLVTVPTFRVDVTREVDLVEEVGRHYGFDRVPARFPALTAPQAAPDPRIARDRLVRQALTSAGFSESMTFAFVETHAALPFCEPGVEPAAIANPLSEKFAVLRPSLLVGLTDSCAHNRRRGRKDVRLFETGSRFTSVGEGRAAALAWCGAASGLHWSGTARNVDFFDVKGAVELLCAAFGVHAPDFVPLRGPLSPGVPLRGPLSPGVPFQGPLSPGVPFRGPLSPGQTSDGAYLVPGRAAAVHAGGAPLGVVGQLSPRIAEARGFPAGEEIYVAEIDTDALGRASTGDGFTAASLPRFPSIVRDVSILVDEALPAAAVRGTIRSAAPPTLASIAEFDRYQGQGVPEGRVSLSLRLTFRAPERTLTDAEAQDATTRIVEALRDAHGAEQR